MILERNRESLGEDIYSLFGTTNDEEILEFFKKKLTEKLELINRMINTDYDKLTNEEYYYLLRNLYGIKLEERDFLAYISKIRNKKYTSFYTIPTTMIFKDYKSEGKGINYSYWKQPYQVFVKVAISEGTKIESKKNYSKVDIRNMHLANKITVLDYESMEVEDFVRDMEEFDEYPAPPNKLAKRIVPHNEEYKEEFDFYMEAIRRTVNKNFIMRNLRKYVEELNEELYDIFIYSSMSYGYGEVAKKCKEWFKENNISDSLNDISKRLSKRRN